MYPPELVIPRVKDLTDFGFNSLNNAEEVTTALSNNEGTSFVVVNSICGCAAAHARPGAKRALLNDKRPENLYTVFAGVQRDATDKVREFMLPYPPSSPSMALFKNGELVFVLERREIEGSNDEMIAAKLKAAFDELC